MERVVAFVAGAQAAEVVQMGEGAFDYPALAAEAGAVDGAAAGDQRFDVARPEQSTVLVVVVAAVGENHVGFLARAAALASDWAGVQRVEERQKLGDVVAVPAGQRDGQRNASRVDEEVMFRAGAGTIDRGWPRQEPPKRARIWLPSTAARDQSIAPAALSLRSNC